jgi:hypothetical protein
LKRNSRISEFLFKDLVFLSTSLGFSMLLNLGRFVKKGLLKVNAGVFSIVVLYFDILRHFLFINNESAGGGFGSDSLATKEVCGRGFGVGKVICISFYLGVSVLNSMLDILFISFCIISPCFGVEVLKFSNLIFSI